MDIVGKTFRNKAKSCQTLTCKVIEVTNKGSYKCLITETHPRRKDKVKQSFEPAWSFDNVGGVWEEIKN